VKQKTKSEGTDTRTLKETPRGSTEVLLTPVAYVERLFTTLFFRKARNGEMERRRGRGCPLI
jgi:hypothetical protein